MDKETLIRLATPASIFLLAVSIITYPLIANASHRHNSSTNPLYVWHVNRCN